MTAVISAERHAGDRVLALAGLTTGPVMVALDGSTAAEQLLWRVRPLAERLRLPLVVSSGALLAEITAVRPSLVAVLDRRRPGVLGSRRAELPDELLRGGVAPILRCKPWTEGEPPSRPVRRILVPLDGSARATAVLPLVEDLGRAYDATVLLLRVSRRRDHLHDPWPITATALAHSLYPARVRLASAGLNVQVIGRFGDAAAEIVSCAEEHAADLLVMAHRPRGGLARLLGGSHVDYVRREFRGALLVQPST